MDIDGAAAIGERLLAMKAGTYAQLELDVVDRGHGCGPEPAALEHGAPPSPNAEEAAKFCVAGEVEEPDSVAVELRPARLLTEFARAVVPLCMFVSIYCQLVGGVWVLQLDVALGLACVVVGLAIFKYGLIAGLMPLGRSIGRRLALKVSAIPFLLVTGILGVLITYAEPGVNSLQLVGKIMKKRETLLQLLLRKYPFRLLTSIAIGVGAAASVGVLRLKHRWSVKPIVFCVTIPVLFFSGMCRMDAELAEIVGVCWDSGAITTGPATVPIVVALGLGIAHSAREHAHAPEIIGRSASDDPVMAKRDTTSDVEGFGIVTLASLFPICTVMVLCILMRVGDLKENGGIVVDLPVNQSSLLRSLLENPAVEYQEEALVEQVEAELDWDWWEEFPLLQLVESVRAVVPLTTFLFGVQYLVIREPLPSLPQRCRGVLAVLVGLFVFNTGLFFGSIPLGKSAGEILPRAAAAHEGVVGVAMVFVFAFVSGFIATIVDLEPCGLGETVEHLTRGKFTKRHLFVSVATGVGVGVILGFCKLLYRLNLMVVLSTGYLVALALTAICDDGMATVAWDSAGVTTGPVTVPLVLSVGAGIANAANVHDGFGILACASVCPIISVLVVSIWKVGVHVPDVSFVQFASSQLPVDVEEQ